MLPETLFAPRWRGQPGRLEVWYTTLTDPSTRTGVWLHHELVAPTDGGRARVHGWVALFPPDAPPVVGRFGPVPYEQPSGANVISAAEVSMSASRLTGSTGELSWDLEVSGGGAPLCTFPAWAWQREVLPAAQVVPAPTATFDGSLHQGGSELALHAAPGGTAHIYGHGNAERWSWLHADLGGGDVLELVSAVSRRPGLRALRPLTFLRLRVGSDEWPGIDPLLAALRFRAHIGLPHWSVSGRIGHRRIRVEVTQPADGTVALAYEDPDGAPATCHNSERADARIVWERRDHGGWSSEREWHLDGTAHAEVGSREKAG